MIRQLTVNYPATESSLYRRLPGQLRPQPCIVELDCQSGTLTARYDECGPGEWTSAQWLGFTMHWLIPCLTAKAATELLDEVAPLASRVVNGWRREWDGSQHVGRLSPDAESASETIDALIDTWDWTEEDQVQVYDAADWLCPHGDAAARQELNITGATTDGELWDMMIQVEAEAAPIVLDGTLRALKELRDEARDAEDAADDDAEESFEVQAMRVAEEMARIDFETAPEPAREPEGLGHLTPAARREVALARLVISVGGETLVCEWRAVDVMSQFRVSPQVAFAAMERYPAALVMEAEWRLESLGACA